MSEAPIVAIQDVSKIANARKLFTRFSFGIFAKEKIGVIGPNGSGKSSLIKILAGIEDPDEGQRTLQNNKTVGYVPQETEFPEQLTAEEYFSWALRRTPLPRDEVPVQTAIALNLLQIEPRTLLSQLSGGWKKRVAIMGELLKKPDVLFLDEPTNHLDFEGIRWLEKELRQFKGAFALISHDRSFLEKSCNRMIEINPRYREGYFSCQGNYSLFLQQRDDYLISLQQYEQSLANKVRREVAWLRQGVKARTTKSKSRIAKAFELQEELQETRTQLKSQKSKIEFSESEKNRKKLVEIKELSYDIGDKELFKDFNFNLRKKDRVALIGPNGCGKSTLLRLISNKIQPTTGEVIISKDLNVVYFEQDRSSLNPNANLLENLCETGDHVIFQGRSIHVASYAKRFLFNEKHSHLPVSRLSGGEQARLLIAKLMLQPADILLLDEPTNDLDIETMEVFAESLLNFEGAVVLVSHDRYFIDQICDQFLSIEFPDCQIFASLRQWEADQAQKSAKKKADEKEKQGKESNQKLSNENNKKKFKPKRMSYKDKREWEQMENKILVAEDALSEWKSKVEDPSVASSPDDLKEAFAKMSEAQSLVDQLYERWAELEKQQDPR